MPTLRGDKPLPSRSMCEISGKLSGLCLGHVTSLLYQGWDLFCLFWVPCNNGRWHVAGSPTWTRWRKNMRVSQGGQTWTHALAQ